MQDLLLIAVVTEKVLNAISLTLFILMVTFNSLLCLTPEDFPRQCGKSSGEGVSHYSLIILSSLP